MEEKKSLYDISWQVDEPTYRQDPALSYSTLARFEREGFNNLDKLFDKINTPSLTFGSCVDTLITDGEEAFNNNFFVTDFPEVSDTIVQIVKDLFREFNITHNSLEDIPNIEIIGKAANYNYQNNWKPETRAKVIKEKGSEYYKLLYLAEDKTIISTKEYQDVINSVKALKESDATSWYFAPNNPFDNIERFYQLKFKANLEEVNYRCMADLIICNYNTKEIFLIDLKTSSHTEWDFYRSFIDWCYHIQGRLYYRIIVDNLLKDDYFKNFKVHNYKFIVVNKRTLTPLVWDFQDTKTIGNLHYGKNNQIEFRDPFEIGKELNYYLSLRPKVPVGIKNENNLTEWLNKL